jgi:hypothetical protein
MQMHLIVNDIKIKGTGISRKKKKSLCKTARKQQVNEQKENKDSESEMHMQRLRKSNARASKKV